MNAQRVAAAAAPVPGSNPGLVPAVAAFIGLGANLGDADATLQAAVAELAGLRESSLVSMSSVYRSAPIDSGGPDYRNAVARIDTRLAPLALLAELQRIEGVHGRQRPYRNAPRTLDLDLLLYGDHRIDTPTLTVPHPRLHERAFVLMPLAQIAPELEVAGRGRVRELLAGVSGQRVERVTPTLHRAGRE